MPIESVMPSNHLILCCPLLLPHSNFPSIRVFSNESVLHLRWQKYWNFSFSISPFNEYSGLNSFRMDWLDLLAVQGTLKSLLQHHSSKPSILRHSAFFCFGYYIMFIRLNYHLQRVLNNESVYYQSQICLWVSRSPRWKHGLTVSCCVVRDTEYNSVCTSRFEGGCHYSNYPYQSLASGQTPGKEHSTAHQQEIGLKIYWAWPHSSEQNPGFPTVGLSHQEVSLSLFTLFIRGQTDWKPQSQKNNQADHMDHSLV